MCGGYTTNYTHSIFGTVCKSCVEVDECVCCGEIKQLFSTEKLKDKKLPTRGNLSLLNNFKICIDCYQNANLEQVGEYSHQTSCSTHLFKPHYKPNTLYFGLENEMEMNTHPKQQDIFRNIFVGEMRKIFSKDEAVFKHDGSLYNGVECVFYPMSYEYLQEQKSRFAHMFTNTRLLRGESSFSISGSKYHAGMHIHLSKDAFTTLHKMKFIHFIQAYSSFVYWIAERSRNDYNKAASTSARIKAAAGYKQVDRYESVNMCPTNTMEIRVFAGATSLNQYMKNIEFLHALYEFTQNTALAKCTVGNFITYIMGNSGHVELKKWFNLEAHKEKFEKFSQDQSFVKE
jgi:hypothetical protein